MKPEMAVAELCLEISPNLIIQAQETIIVGQERVDLRAALAELRSAYRVKRLRVDSGGILNGVLLRAGLVEEIAVIINPCLTGGTSPRTFFVADDLRSRDGVMPLSLQKIEELRDGYLWLQYEVIQSKEAA